MPFEVRSNKEEKRGIQETQQVTRRQFLKEAGVIIGGTVVAAIPLAPGCGSSGDTTTSNTTTTTNTSTTTPITTTNTNTITTTPTTTINNNTTTTTTWTDVYTPPVLMPELEQIQGCETFVAMDRLYAIEHTWVKPITDDVVVVGITDKFQAFLENIYDVSLPDVGTTLYRYDYLAAIGATKMSVELVSPVSGIVLQNNTELYEDCELISRSPYKHGWLVVIQLSNKEELKELMTPEENLIYCAKILDA